MFRQGASVDEVRQQLDIDDAALEAAIGDYAAELLAAKRNEASSPGGSSPGGRRHKLRMSWRG